MKKSIAALLLVATQTLSAASFLIKDGKANFGTTASPGFLAIDGEGGKVFGELKTDSDGKLSGELASNLADYDTGIDLRNKHLREKYLEVKKYPEAKLTFSGVDMKAPSGKVEAKLTLKKETRKVIVNYHKRDGTVYAKTSIEIKDYPSIGVPQWLGVTAASRVDIYVEFPFAS